MYIVTNRDIDPDTNKTWKERIGDTPNRKGPNELGVLEATRSGDDWRVKIFKDDLTASMRSEMGPDLGGDDAHAGDYVAFKLFQQVRAKKRNVLFFVHGFNNDLESVLNRAERFSKNFGVEVIPFAWPAKGGGIRGTLEYLGDKRDARASVGALDRVLSFFDRFLREDAQDEREKARSEAKHKHPNDAETQARYFSKRIVQRCPFTVNMLAHSMGNYVLKNVLDSAAYRGDRLIFDNIVLAAADTNNEGHAAWVDRLRVRNRIYVTINEKDEALRASRMKAGDEQRSRLGHYLYRLDSRRAVYVDLTDAAWVKGSHAYFEGTPLRNDDVKRFFRKAFNGKRAETDLRYVSAQGTYRVRRPRRRPV